MKNGAQRQKGDSQMNIRKTIDYSAMYTELDALIGQSLPQMELYREIGRLICSRPEKGAAIMTSEYLQKNYPDVAGFSPRNVRRMREFIRTYEGNEALMAEAMKIGWTQNVLIMERCADDAECQWYIKAVLCFGWSKLELAAKIDDEAHLKMSLAPQEEGYDNENRGTEKVTDAEPPHIFSVALPDGLQTPAVGDPYPRPKSRGHPSQYRWDFYGMELLSQTLTNIRSVNCWQTATDASLFYNYNKRQGAYGNEKELFYVCKGTANHVVHFSSCRCT